MKREVRGLPTLCHCDRDDSQTRQSIVSWGRRAGITLRCGRTSGSPRAAPSRWQGGGVFQHISLHTQSLSLRGGRQSDAAIHRVSEDADVFVSSLAGSQWIATGFQPSRW